MENEFKQIDSSVIRIVLYGPESTGKTTLAKALAEYYKTAWVPEYMRTFLENKFLIPGEEIVAYNELMPIAKGQIATENKALTKAKKFLFCDTNLLEIEVYADYYFDRCPEEIRIFAQENTYDLYLLTYIDTIWEEDDFRDSPENRQEFFKLFEDKLICNNLPYLVVKGSMQERMNTVISELERLFG